MHKEEVNAMAKTSTPKVEKTLKTDFDSVVDDVLSQQENKKILKSALWQKLDELGEGIKRLRLQGVTYKSIVQIIGEVTERHGVRLKVSEQTLRQFCQDRLKLPKVTRKSVSSENK